MTSDLVRLEDRKVDAPGNLLFNAKLIQEHDVFSCSQSSEARVWPCHKAQLHATLTCSQVDVAERHVMEFGPRSSVAQEGDHILYTKFPRGDVIIAPIGGFDRDADPRVPL